MAARSIARRLSQAWVRHAHARVRQAQARGEARMARRSAPTREDSSASERYADTYLYDARGREVWHETPWGARSTTAHVGAERRACERAVANPMPPCEHLRNLVEHPLADSCRFASAFYDSLDVSLDVSPAELKAAIGPQVVCAVLVGNKNAEPVSEQLLGSLGVAPCVDHEDDHMRGDDRPQPDSGPAHALAKACLVGVFDGLLLDVAPRFRHRIGNGRTRGLLTSDNCTDRHLQAEKVAYCRGSAPHHRHEPDPEPPSLPSG
jgi:hypothetical protein